MLQDTTYEIGYDYDHPVADAPGDETLDRNNRLVTWATLLALVAAVGTATVLSFL